MIEPNGGVERLGLARERAGAILDPGTERLDGVSDLLKHGRKRIQRGPCRATHHAQPGGQRPGRRTLANPPQIGSDDRRHIPMMELVIRAGRLGMRLCPEPVGCPCPKSQTGGFSHLPRLAEAGDRCIDPVRVQ
jgi:hypothetical protein